MSEKEYIDGRSVDQRAASFTGACFGVYGLSYAVVRAVNAMDSLKFSLTYGGYIRALTKCGVSKVGGHAEPGMAVLCSDISFSGFSGNFIQGGLASGFLALGLICADILNERRKNRSRE